MRFSAIAAGVFLLSVPAASGQAGAEDIQRANAPRAVNVARATAIPKCTVFVDRAFAGSSNGTAARPHKTIRAAVGAVRPGGVICVAQGVYAEQVRPRTKPFTLAGGFQRGKAFKVRDSARYVSRAQGSGTGSFIRIEDPGPSGKQRTVIDGFEITGYSQAIFRDYWQSQRFDITNNHIHDNTCEADGQAGAGFALVNVSGTIRGNVFRNNSCWRGGAGFINDTLNENSVVVRNNRVEINSGTEPSSAHGGAFYFFANRLDIIGNLFTGNSVTGWGGGLYLGAYTTGGQFTNGKLSWNVYRNNRAGIYGGGFFCDDSANCASEHELYDRNCGGNIYLDGASGGRDATIASFDHLTNVNARTVGCKAPGPGVQIDKDNTTPDTYTFTNALFWGNARGLDFVASCQTGCDNGSIDVSYSMVQRRYLNQGFPITFGRGILAPANPLFVDPAKGDFHLKSRFGHWTANGYRRDTVSSPALGKGTGPVDAQPPRAGPRPELGTYGNSVEASFVR